MGHLLYVRLLIDDLLDHRVLHASYAHSLEALAGKGTLPRSRPGHLVLVLEQISMLCFEVLLSIIFRQILFVVALASFPPCFVGVLFTMVEYLVNFKALHELADSGKVVESEIAFSVPIENFEAVINLISLKVGANSLCNLPELVFVYMTHLIVWVKEAEHIHERAVFHLQSLP